MGHRRRALLTAGLCLSIGALPISFASGQCSTQTHVSTAPSHGGCCGDGHPSQWSDHDPPNYMIAPVTKIEVWSDNEVRGIRLTYGDKPGPIRGSNGNPPGNLSAIDLDPGEFVNSVTGRSGQRIDQICFATNRKPTKQCFGGGGGNAFPEDDPQGRPMVGIYGDSGDGELNGLGFFYGPFSQIDVTTFKYNQADLDNALTGAQFDSFVEPAHNTGTVPLQVTFQQQSQLTHTETLQLTQTETSTHTADASAGLTLSAASPATGASIMSVLSKGLHLAAAGGPGGGGTGVNASFSYTWTDTITNQAQQIHTDTTQTTTGWSVVYSLPGNMDAKLTTIWKQVKLDLPITYDLVVYNDDGSEICRQTMTGRVKGVGSSDLTHIFTTSPIGQNNFTVAEYETGQKPNK